MTLLLSKLTSLFIWRRNKQQHYAANNQNDTRQCCSVTVSSILFSNATCNCGPKEITGELASVCDAIECQDMFWTTARKCIGQNDNGQRADWSLEVSAPKRQHVNLRSGDTQWPDKEQHGHGGKTEGENLPCSKSIDYNSECQVRHEYTCPKQSNCKEPSNCIVKPDRQNIRRIVQWCLEVGLRYYLIGVFHWLRRRV